MAGCTTTARAGRRSVSRPTTSVSATASTTIDIDSGAGQDWDIEEDIRREATTSERIISSTTPTPKSLFTHQPCKARHSLHLPTTSSTSLSIARLLLRRCVSFVFVLVLVLALLVEACSEDQILSGANLQSWAFRVTLATSAVRLALAAPTSESARWTGRCRQREDNDEAMALGWR